MTNSPKRSSLAKVITSNIRANTMVRMKGVRGSMRPELEEDVE
jgi:hypothetical protein